MKTTSTLYRLLIDVPNPLGEIVAAELFTQGLQGLEEQQTDLGARLIVCGEDRHQIESYAQRAKDYLTELAEWEQGVRQATVRVEKQEDSDWATAWMKHFRQTPVTPTVVVQPTWEKLPPPAGMRRLFIQPKMAFGFGTHATTQLIARAVERQVMAHPGGALLDVGTGTGILSLIAVAAGATHASGIDIDPVAVDCARENASLNGMSRHCSFSNNTLSTFTEPFALVAANITAPVLAELAPDLARLTQPGGRLLLSGILDPLRQEALLPFADLGMDLVGHEAMDDWCLLELEHE